MLFSFELFSININSEIVLDWFIASICFEAIQVRSKSNSVPLARKEIWKPIIVELRNANHEIFTEECEECIEKHVRKCLQWAKLFSVQDKDSQGRFIKVSTSEMVDSVNKFILADWRRRIVYIPDQREILVGTANRILYDDITFSKVSCCQVPKIISLERKQRNVQLSQLCLSYFGEDFLKKIISYYEIRVCNNEPESKRQFMKWKTNDSPVK